MARAGVTTSRRARALLGKKATEDRERRKNDQKVQNISVLLNTFSSPHFWGSDLDASALSRC
jgi:hypothetical protein